MRAIHVEDVAAPQFLELIAEGIDVGAKPTAEQLGLQLTHVEFQFVARDLGELGGVFRAHVPDIGAPLLRDLDLAPRGGDRAGAGGDRQRAKIIVAGLVAAPAGVPERGGVRDLHAVAGTHADDVRRAGVHDEAHVRPIDAHPERHRRDDDVGPLVEKRLLMPAAHVVGEAGVIRHARVPLSAQPFGQRLDLAARRAVDDARLAVVAREDRRSS